MARNDLWLFFLFPPTSLKHELYGLTSGFTRLIMTKYACYGLISLHAKFHDNQTKWTEISNMKICRWGEKEKEPDLRSQMISTEFKISCTLTEITITRLFCGIQYEEIAPNPFPFIATSFKS